MRILTIDGESIAPYGYCLLASSAASQLVRTRRLSSLECFRFLLDEAEGADRVFGYGIGYDVCHWIADLEDREKRLLATEGRCYTLQGATCYRVTYRPGAYFKLEELPGLPGRDWKGGKAVRSVLVCDLMRWHRRPLVDVCFEWDCISDETAEMLRSTKGIRSAFSADMLDGIAEYCAVECLAAEELARTMVADAERTGLPKAHPFTCGTVAGHLAHQHKVGDQRRDGPPELAPVLPVAFFGGREQCSRFGKFPKATQWDLRSAYGWALLQLPDLLGEWQHIRAYPRLSKWGVWRVSWDFPEGSFPLFPFPWRDAKGRIHYPPRGQGWYWSPIVRSALRHYPGDCIQIHEGWQYEPETDGGRPFGYIGGLYDQRIMLGRDPAEGLLKGVIVATWGRLCSQGRRHSPTRGILEWAGMTTSLIQERLLDAIWETGPEEFISCCVDGFWTTGKPLVADRSQRIGEWAHKRDAELLLLSPLHFWAREREEWRPSLAGVPGGDGLIEEALAIWEERGPRGVLPFSWRRCVGLLAAATSGDYSRMGSFTEEEKRLRFLPGTGHECPTQRGRDGWHRWLSYWPPCPIKGAMSAPYQPRRGILEDRWMEATVAEAIEEVMA